jgi:tetratricopeptide (TPR) repeat protein
MGDPALAGHPREAAVLANAAEVSYHRGDYDRAEQLARAALDLPGGQASAWYCLTVLAVVALARGAFTDVIELSLDATARRTPPRDGPGLAALAAAYRGDPERARTLHAPGRAAATSPSMRAWASYVDGEIDNCAGDDGRAERHYLSAIELARSSGASFLVGVATVGLLSVRARSGRTDDALRGYREVTDYFARTGNWTHLWTTLRNLADLLRRLGDSETAAVINAAADRAPDAPATPRRAAAANTPVPTRTALLELARVAIDRNLGASTGTPPRASG